MAEQNEQEQVMRQEQVNEALQKKLAAASQQWVLQQFETRLKGAHGA